MNRSYKYRIYANQETLSKAEAWLESCRRLYNLCLEQRIYAWRRLRRSTNWCRQSRELTELRKEFPEFRKVNRDVQDRILKRLHLAYRSFFRRGGFPRFKPQDRFHSFTYRKFGWKITGRKLHLTDIGIFKIKLSRPIEGEIKTVSIIRKAGNKWFVCFCCANVPPNVFPKTTNQIGIDVGCESFLTTSGGEKIENPLFRNSSQEKLTKAQQVLARRKLRSHRRRKQRELVAKIHERIRNQRQDFHRKVAYKLLQENQVICIEKLTYWKTKWRKLNRSMSDTAFWGFLDLLKCKAESAGREVVEVNPKHTSQICSDCGQVVMKDLSVRVHNCSCGLTIDRDHNAALNILRLGQSLRGSPRQ